MDKNNLMSSQSKPIKTNRSVTSLLTTLIIGVVLATTISCQQSADPLLDMLDTQLSNMKVDTLSRTMNFVVSPDRFDKDQFEEKLAASLNRWAKSESESMSDAEWQLDPTVAKLAEQFEGSDGSDDSSGDALAEAMAKLNAGLSEDDAEDLASTVKLFDWVVRNIHLLPEDDLTGDAEDLSKLKLNDSEDLVAAGVPGLGYTRFPSQTMMYSRGDYVDRAKLFMTMVSQLDIDSVILIPKSEDGAGKPWAVGVNIGGKLYLFDTKLGLPIPGPEPGMIATLADARSAAETLDSLDLSVQESLKDETKYWVKSDQLKNLDAVVFAPPESTSYRIWELENKLVGDTRMRLALDPSSVFEKMPKLEGVEYGVWDIGYKTHLFRLALREAIAASSFSDSIRNKLGWYYSNELYVDDFVRYRTARSKYFNGLFETIRNDGNLNAIELFYSMIYKDSKINSLMTDLAFQVRLRVTQGSMDVEQWKGMINGVQANMRLVRRDSGFFLSQCHFDNGNFSTAANWLTRLEQVADTARWQPAINYLRARSLEAQGDYKSAIDIYKKQESEQFHGDLIRARQIKTFVNESE